jgi:hypothetical protein
MNDNPATAIAVVEEHGSFLLIRSASRFAVVERRGRPDLSDDARQTERRADDPGRDGVGDGRGGHIARGRSPTPVRRALRTRRPPRTANLVAAASW